ncbi:epoxide hydrolase [Boothiomyces sp. JEL0866]|nr:epoxide hydrolase [Boothiomyces sp. JEL0866]
MIHPFQFTLSQQEINTLKSKIDNAKYPQAIDGVNDGTDLLALKLLAKKWCNYDFTKFQTKINKYPQYKTEIDGIDVHFVHVKNNGQPLLLLHGWPGCILEFWDLIPLLDNFDLVIPSLPGFGFSSAPTKPGYGIGELACIFNKLMIKLGYNEYLAQGGDWGGVICKVLAINHPECKGIHVNFVPTSGSRLNDIFMFLPPFLLQIFGYSQKEVNGMKKSIKHLLFGTGYMLIHATKPLSVSYGLTDSPVGLLGYLLEKYHDWSAKLLTDEQILEIVSLYWFTNTISSSVRIYKEYLNKYGIGHIPYCSKPTGVIMNDHELFVFPKSFIDSSYNLVQWKEHTRGHFLALEDPHTLAVEVKKFAKGYPYKQKLSLICWLCKLIPGYIQSLFRLKSVQTKE